MVMNFAEIHAFVLSELSGDIFVFEKRKKGFKKYEKYNFGIDIVRAALFRQISERKF